MTKITFIHHVLDFKSAITSISLNTARKLTEYLLKNSSIAFHIYILLQVLYAFSERECLSIIRIVPVFWAILFYSKMHELSYSHIFFSTLFITCIISFSFYKNDSGSLVHWLIWLPSKKLLQPFFLCMRDRFSQNHA